MTSHIAAIATVALVTLVACGGGSTENNPSGGGAAFSATIDGAAWNSLAITSAVSGSANGTFSLVGSNSVTATPTTMSITLYNIGVPGTYPIGVGGSVTGGTAVLSSGTSSWSTPLSGSAGTVTITSVSATRIAGAFSFVATPTSGTAANKTVSNGQFDLAVTSAGSVAVADKFGGSFSGTLAGSPFTAATLVMVALPSSGTLTIGASNNVYTVNIMVSGYTGAGTYSMGTGVQRSVTTTTFVGGTKTWGGSNALTSGTIIVTSSTATRVKGTINVTMQPGVASPGPTPITLVSAFDVGIP